MCEDIKSNYEYLSNIKDKLESVHLNGKSKDIISEVEFILNSEKAIESKKLHIIELESSEKLLKNQSFSFSIMIGNIFPISIQNCVMFAFY